MYSVSQLLRGLRSPNLFFREANRLFHRRLNLRPYNIAGVDVFEEDWDNLLILDACRYDMFVEQSDLSGSLQARVSRGSSTQEFLKGNFLGRELLDTVYVTANPQFHRHREWLGTTFHAIEDVWQSGGWDETYQTVLPGTVVDAALEAEATYPKKRLIVHFIQPHYPFIGGGNQPFDNSQAFLKPDEPGSWQQLMTGALDTPVEAVWQAYRDNLDVVLPHVERLLDELDGKSVVSADHGNMVGERAWPFPIREWGHPRGIYTEQLVKVPWLVVNDPRRGIVPDPPVDAGAESTDEESMERLKQLGYL